MSVQPSVDQQMAIAHDPEMLVRSTTLYDIKHVDSVRNPGGLCFGVNT